MHKCSFPQKKIHGVVLRLDDFLFFRILSFFFNIIFIITYLTVWKNFHSAEKIGDILYCVTNENPFLSM